MKLDKDLIRRIFSPQYRAPLLCTLAVAAVLLTILILILKWLFGASQGWHVVVNWAAVGAGICGAFRVMSVLIEGRIDLFRPVSFVIAAVLSLVSGAILCWHISGNAGEWGRQRTKETVEKNLTFEAMVMNPVTPAMVFLTSLLLGTLAEAAGHSKAGSQRTKELAEKVATLNANVETFREEIAEIGECITKFMSKQRGEHPESEEDKGIS